MKKLLLLFLLALPACPLFVQAQISPQISGAGAPSNPCFNGGQQYVDTTNHVLYACPSNGANWVNISLGNLTNPTILSRSSDPATCSTTPPVGESSMYYNTASAVFKYCSATNTWTSFGTGAGSVTSSGSPVAGNIPKFTSATNIAPAAATDLIALWTGSCDATHFLRGDGACATAGGALADPGGNGVLVRTALNTTSAVSIAATSPVTVTNADGTAGNPTLACATCTTNASALTSNAIVLGGGSQASKVVAGLTTDGTAGINVGATGVGGTITLFGATSGSGTLTAPGNGTQLTLSHTTLRLAASGSVSSASGTMTLGSLSGNVIIQPAGGNINLAPPSGNGVVTGTNCAAVGTSANPSVASCTAAIAGSFSCATNASTGTCTVNTTAVTANSQIFITQRTDTTTGTRLSVTCNTTIDTVQRAVTAVTAATSFTINLGTITTNPECFSYFILN